MRKKVECDLRESIHEARLRFRPDSTWSYYNSSIDNYDDDFVFALSGRKTESLIADKESPVVVDLMAPSGTLASLFKRFPEKKCLGIAVSLDDLRDEQDKARDKQLGITQLSADITRPSAWREIEAALGGRKADLIMERGFGGLGYLPENYYFFVSAVRKIWNLLAENGAMVLECFLDLHQSAKNWTELLSQVGIEANYSRGIIYVKKTQASPRELPFSEFAPNEETDEIKNQIIRPFITKKKELNNISSVITKKESYLNNSALLDNQS